MSDARYQLDQLNEKRDLTPNDLLLVKGETGFDYKIKGSTIMDAAPHIIDWQYYDYEVEGGGYKTLQLWKTPDSFPWNILEQHIHRRMLSSYKIDQVGLNLLVYIPNQVSVLGIIASITNASEVGSNINNIQNLNLDESNGKYTILRINIENKRSYTFFADVTIKSKYPKDAPVPVPIDNP